MDDLIQQNKLLREQNDLLREQNFLLRQTINPLPQDEDRETFIEDINRDEIRSSILVTSHKKKLWNVQIGLMEEFARICKKHDLRWFAIGGTLLGAARHKGFIPWDFDIDVIMFRPDYNKFQQVAAEEVQSPYFLDVWYNYRLESEGASLNDAEGDFQFITFEQEQAYVSRWLTQWPSIRLRDNRTTMIESPERNFINQGIWIDIFPLDPLPPFANTEQATLFEMAQVLLLATAAPLQIKKAMQAGQNLLFDYDELKEFLSYPYRERGKIFDYFMNKNFFMSERVGDIRDYCITTGQKYYQSKDFTDVTWLPFEKVEVPAPVGYESVLSDYYGDWRKLVVFPPHVFDFSADFSYKEYFKRKSLR